MSRLNKLSCFPLLLLFPFTQAVAEQPADTTGQGLEIGLVLSGGGAKGLAHIGVIEVLEEAGIEIDYIAGSSMGGIIGALYSIGYSTEEMRELAKSTDWEELFADRPGRRLFSMYEKENDEQFIVTFPLTERGINLPSGMVAGQNVLTWLSSYTWPAHTIEDFSEYPIPFITVATDIETGDPVIFRSGYLPDALRATISLPSLMMPYTVDGLTFIDGGLSLNLPVEEVRNMGADYVIAVDVSSPLRSNEELVSMVTVFNQALNFRVNENTFRQKSFADLVIEVDELADYTMVDFYESEQFMEIGRNSAREKMSALRDVATLQGDSKEDKFPLSAQPVMIVDSLSVSGNDLIPSGFVISELGIDEGDIITLQQLDQQIRQLYSTRFFKLVSYRISLIENSRYHIEIRVLENNNDPFRVGVRYESETHAAIKLQAKFRNLIHRGSSLRLNLRLGDFTEFQTDYLYFGGMSSRIGIRSRLEFQREELSYYSENSLSAQLTHTQLTADIFAGSILHRRYQLGLGIQKEYNRFINEINPGQIPFSEEAPLSFYGLFQLDTLNRRSYPVQGHRIVTEALFTDSGILSPVTFNRQMLFWNGWYPLSENVTLTHTLFTGRSYGQDIPWSHWFSVNRYHSRTGYVRFGGYERYELTGRNIQMFSAGIQVELMRHRFLRVNGYTGRILPEWDWNFFDGSYRTGMSVSAGLLSVLGPVEAILSFSGQNRFLFEIQVGYEF